MKCLFCVLGLFLGLVPTLGWGATLPEPTLQDRAVQFLQDNVMGRTQQIITEGTVQADGQTYAVKFNAIIKWCNFSKTPSGLVFDQIREIQQSNTKLDSSGHPTEEVQRNDRVVAFHYALAERQTSTSLVGLATMTKNTLDDPTGIGYVAMIELSDDNKELYLYESQAGFSERTLDGQTIIPLAAGSEATFFLDDKGKLQTNQTLKFYKVDVNNDFARTEVDRFNLSAAEVAR